MPAISLPRFGGEIPRIRPHLLPAESAQLCENVDLSDGALTPLRNGLLLRNMLSSPVRGIYTEDGINFYTWSVETLAFQSPIIDDTQNRMYFLQPSVGTFNVSRTLQMAANGPSPTQTYRAGVPQPQQAPAVSVTDMDSYPDYPDGVTFELKHWWNDAGVTTEKTDGTLTTVRALRSFSFSLPTRPPEIDATAKLHIEMRIMSLDTPAKEIAVFSMREGESASSSGLPGTVTARFERASTCTVNLEYGVPEDRAYVYTYENSMGEEGAPSPPTVVSPTYVQAVVIGVTMESFVGFLPFQKLNIYRTFGSSATYVKTKVTQRPDGLWQEWATKAADTGSALASTDWLPSPTGLAGVELMPNGWFAAFKGNMLHLSEPYRPHAWPYSIPFKSVIRGVRAGQGQLVVTTADGLYVINGSFPSGAQAMKISLPQPGVAQRSMVVVDGGVAYASNDGIVVIEGTAASTAAGGKLFTRKVWRDRYSASLLDASMTFGYHDGRLVMSSKTLGAGFIVRLDEEVGAFSRTTANYDAMFLLPVTDTLYYSVGQGVYRYNAGSALTADWHSKDFMFPNPVSFGAGRILCDGQVRLRLYANGVLVADRTLMSGYFRFDNLLPQERWSIRLTTSATVTQFAIARSMLELQDV